MAHARRKKELFWDPELRCVIDDTYSTIPVQVPPNNLLGDYFERLKKKKKKATATNFG
jgi:hypothetical protein